MTATWVARLAWALGLSIVVLATSSADAQRRRRRPTGDGTLILTSTIEGAEVLVDEESIGFTPLEGPIPLSPGSHTVRVRRPGFTEFSEVVQIEAGQSLALPVELFPLSMVLTVRTEPDEARVFVDGRFRGTTPIELELDEGEHSIRITHPTHREVVRTVNAVAGTTQALDLALEALPPEELGSGPPPWYEDPVLWISVGAGVAVAAIAAIVLAVTLGGPDAMAQYQAFCGAAGEICITVEPDWNF